MIVASAQKCLGIHHCGHLDLSGMVKAVVGHVYQGHHTQNDLTLECVHLVMIDRSSIAPKAGLMVKGRKKITSAGMTLVTLMLQTSEERYNDGERNMKGVFDKIINSYEKMK